jgi:hypothetical protein
MRLFATDIWSGMAFDYEALPIRGDVLHLAGVRLPCPYRYRFGSPDGHLIRVRIIRMRPSRPCSISGGCILPRS